MRLSVRHLTRYRYRPDAASAALRFKLFPSADDGQTPLSWQVSVNGQVVEPILTDAQGDSVGLWHAHGPVGEVSVLAEGIVETADTAGVLRGMAERARPAVFLRATPLTRPSDEIVALAVGVPEQDPLARLHALSAAVHQAIDYRPAASDATTTAAESLALGAGVCQDQAHVFIAAARVLDIPARYVVGYLADPERESAAEDTHAWAEAHVPGLGWTGFDITNRICPTDLYVRLCCGFDAADAAPLRGTVRGNTEEVMEVEIAIEQAQQQQQS